MCRSASPPSPSRSSTSCASATSCFEGHGSLRPSIRAMRIASRTVTGKNQFTVSTWGTYPIESPGSRSIRPAIGSTDPAIALSRVLFPLPEGPTIPMNSPSPISRSTLTRTGSRP